MIRLIIDSTCDMPRSLIEKYGIAVLPLQVIIGEQSFRDGQDIHIGQLYEVMRRGVMPKTSQINMGEAETLFRGICASGDDLIYLCFSSGMSGTCQVAQMLVRDLQEEFPGRRLCVVDSEGGCFATGLIAMQAARWIDSGRDYDEVVRLMHEMIAQIQHLFTLDSLNWLAKGGRINRPVGYMGDVLQIKPILDVQDTTMHVTRLVRGRKQTIRTIVQMLGERMAAFPEQLIGITHADDIDTAREIERMIRANNPAAKTMILPIGCVLGSHLGIGGVGLFFVKKKPEGYDLLSEPMGLE